MDIESAYIEALEFTKNHYENFPVVSFLIPKMIRKDVAIIYRFARTADDIADEGMQNPEERLSKLNEFENRFTELLSGNFVSPFEQALYTTIQSKNLTVESFYNLLRAFRQDITKNRFIDYNDLLAYCNNSANPVGRLILELNNIRDKEAFACSDKICTALQLANFWQDAAIDYKKGRIYLPQDEMAEFNVAETVFELNENNLNLKALLKYNVDRTRALFDEGKQLTKYLSGRLKFEIKWTILGGQEILKKIEKNNYNVFQKRPVLNKMDFINLLLKSFF
ncbi:MAG: squalene synthase HpnC [Ignavibacteriaceae bacterium]|jgi:squalene synthase HpnC